MSLVVLPEDVYTNSEEEVARMLECCICHQTLQASQLCPSCSQPFCGKCIEKWLITQGKTSCPHCRNHLEASNLVKARAFDQVQEVIGRIFTQNRCDKHKTEKLSLFCFPCEQTICTTCWFSEHHQDHMKQAVLIDEAFGKYQKDLEQELLWIDERCHKVNLALDRAQVEEDRLANEEKRVIEKIKRVEATVTERLQLELKLQNQLRAKLEEEEKLTLRLRETSTSLLKGNRDADTLVQILELTKEIEKLRLNPLPTAPPMEACIKNDVVPEAEVLVFRLSEFQETMKKYSFYESQSQGSCGFEWTVKVTEPKITCHLRLVKGIPGEYSVAIDNKPEQILRFERDALVNVGTSEKLNEDENTLEITIRIQQAGTYAEKCEQQQIYIRQLEAKNVENETFLRYLAEWQSKNGSPTC